MIRPTGFGGRELRAASNCRYAEKRDRDVRERKLASEARRQGELLGREEEHRRHELVMRAPKEGVLIGYAPEQPYLLINLRDQSARFDPSANYHRMVEITAHFEAKQEAQIVYGNVIRWFTWKFIGAH